MSDADVLVGICGMLTSIARLADCDLFTGLADTSRETRIILFEITYHTLHFLNNKIRLSLCSHENATLAHCNVLLASLGPPRLLRIVLLWLRRFFDVPVTEINHSRVTTQMMSIRTIKVKIYLDWTLTLWDEVCKTIFEIAELRREDQRRKYTSTTRDWFDMMTSQECQKVRAGGADFLRRVKDFSFIPSEHINEARTIRSWVLVSVCPPTFPVLIDSVWLDKTIASARKCLPCFLASKHVPSFSHAARGTVST